MVESGIAGRIAARRAELDELEDQLAKQLEEVRAERDELAVAEHVDTVADTQEQEDQIGLPERVRSRSEGDHNGVDAMAASRMMTR
jgi:hypothetical protein